MKLRSLLAGAAVLAIAGTAASSLAQAPAGAGLPQPAIHHVHFNSPNPDAAIDLYIKTNPKMAATNWEGLKALKTTNNVYFVFNKVAKAPLASLPDKITAKTPQTPFWHFVIGTPDLFATLAEYKKNVPDFELRILPLYTDSGGKSQALADVNSLPGFNTEAQLAEMRAKGVQPTGKPSYMTWVGPDGAIIESVPRGQEGALQSYAMFQEQPYCAVLWYRDHLNATIPQPQGNQPLAPQLTGGDCKVTQSPTVSWPSTYKRGHLRQPPSMGVNFGGSAVRWYMTQEKAPIAPMRGSVIDHLGLSVANLDPWIAKLKAEKVKFLTPRPYKVGAYRAILIEGPSREAIELIEIK